MMRMSTKSSTFAPTKESLASDDLEVRPCGMLVQKRHPNSESASEPAPTVRVRVKHGPVTHEVHVSSQATFGFGYGAGELKKLLSGLTGMHQLDQKILFKDRERSSTAYLDTAGFREKSKLVVVMDSKARDKRCLEMRRAAKLEHAMKSITEIRAQVDKLGPKVSTIEAIVSRGKGVAESDLSSLIELLMNELLKLDSITADGDAKIQRRAQVRRVQKHVETLDMLKVKNSMNNVLMAMTTTKWETF